ncbi:MAG TPA: biotin transporter BioY [Tissierellales bacterium]|nr:biotin transporter BioY [Tissierellales bacterium]
MKISTKDMVIVAMFTALTAIGAFLSIPLGNVPISLQSLFTIMSGLILGSKLGTLSQIVYVLLGLIGLRIFAGFTGGLETVLKPSFGYLIGFIFASYIIGKITYTKKNLSFKRILLASIIGTFVIYAFGIPYMYLILNKVMDANISFMTALKTGCLVFLPGDFLKAIVASYVSIKVIPKIKLVENK